MHSGPSSNLPRAGRLRGFTILEVGCTAAILALAIVSSITTMQRAFVSLDSARNVTLAGQIMQGKLEQLRLKDWNTFLGGSGVNGYVFDAAGNTLTQPVTQTIDPSFTSNPKIGANKFTLTSSVTDVNHAAPAGSGLGVNPWSGMKLITLTVSWKGLDGQTLTRTYSSYYGQNGLYDFYYNSF